MLNIEGRLNHIDTMLQRILLKVEKIYDSGKERQAEGIEEQEEGYPYTSPNYKGWYI